MHPRQKQRAASGCSKHSSDRRSGKGKCKVQKPRHHTNEHISKSWDCITSAGATFVARPASLPEREQRLVLLRPGPLPTPDAGKALIHTQVLVPASRITAMCRVRNNRIICQSSDPLEGVAITLNQWILLTARAARPDAAAPNARRGTRLPSPQVPDARIAR